MKIKIKYNNSKTKVKLHKVLENKKYNFSHWDSMPSVSCICITYGRTEFLNEAVHSFLLQDYIGDKELIILNDCADIKYKFKHDKIKIVNLNKKMKILGEKRNEAIKLSSGKIIFMWDDDDISFPWRVSYTLSKMYSTHVLVPDNFWICGKTYDDIRLKRKYGYLNVGAFSREIFDIAGGYPSKSISEDKSLLYKFRKLKRKMNFKIDNLFSSNEDIFYFYRRYTTGYHASDKHFGYYSAEKDVKANIVNGKLLKGINIIKPKWNIDYINLISRFLKKYNV